MAHNVPKQDGVLGVCIAVNAQKHTVRVHLCKLAMRSLVFITQQFFHAIYSFCPVI